MEGRFSACGNVVPGTTSIYRWEGKVQQDRESLIIFKTTEDSLRGLKKRVVEPHPYKVPEFLALLIDEDYLPYLEWVEGEVEDKGRF